MLEIGMDPSLAGGIAWHGIFTALGVAIAVVAVARLAGTKGMDPTIVFNTAMWAVPGGVVGARLVHVIDTWSLYADNPERIFYIWTGGVALFGALLGGTITGVVYAWTRGYPVAKLADLTAPAILIAQAVGRVGDVINGEHFSEATDLPWSWVHTNPDWPGLHRRVPMDPTPAAGGYQPSVGYELVADVLLFFVIWRLIGRVAPDGVVMLIYLASYSSIRFAIQFTRVDPERWGPLQQAHIISLIVIGTCVLLIALLLLRHRARGPATATSTT